MYIFFLMSNKSDICMCIWCDVTLVTQSCPTLCDPMDCSLPGSSVLGIFQARTLEWLAIAFSRGCPQPRNWSRVSHSAGTVFTIWASRQDCMCHTLAFNHQDKVNWKPQCTSMTVQRVLRIPGMKGVGARGLSAHGCLAPCTKHASCKPMVAWPYFSRQWPNVTRDLWQSALFPGFHSLNYYMKIREMKERLLLQWLGDFKHMLQQ